MSDPAPVDWKQIRASMRAAEPGAPGWPDGVHPISMEGLSLLGIGPGNRLYWDGQPIEISRRVSLSWWQTVLATTTALGALAGGVAALLPFFGLKP